MRARFITATLGASCMLGVVAAPAAAEWRPVGPPVAKSTRLITGYDLKRVRGRPYVAWSQWNGRKNVVRVARLARGGTSWIAVGSVVNHDPNRNAFSPSLAEGPGGVPWVAWTEYDRSHIAQIRVAYLGSNGAWREPDPRDWSINRHPPEWDYWWHWERWMSGGFAPHLVFLGRRPYVVYFENGGSGEPNLEFARLADDRRSWESFSGSWRVPRLSGIIPHRVVPAVFDGLLHLGEASHSGDTAEVFALHRRGTWTRLGGFVNNLRDPDGHPIDGFLLDLADLRGTPFALWSPHTIRFVSPYVSRFEGGSWELAGGGPLTRDGAYGSRLRVVGGRLYASWFDRVPPHKLHVSVLSDDGKRWIATAGSMPAGSVAYGSQAVMTGVGGVPYVAWAQTFATTKRLRVARLESAPRPIGPDDHDGSGPGTDPSLATEPVLRPSVIGACGRELRATRYGDAMIGGPFREAMYGYGGNDDIRAEQGADCLFGGTGDDKLGGGQGDDRLYGGPGTDRFYAGRGRDVIHAADGRAELVKCGAGTDRAFVDAADRVHDCEVVVLRG